MLMRSLAPRPPPLSPLPLPLPVALSSLSRPDPQVLMLVTVACGSDSGSGCVGPTQGRGDVQDVSWCEVRLENCGRRASACWHSVAFGSEEGIEERVASVSVCVWRVRRSAREETRGRAEQSREEHVPSGLRISQHAGMCVR
eukprot:882918-Rhodomonas_salina.1